MQIKKWIIPFIIYILFIQFSFGQNTYTGVVVDSETKTPIEFVAIYNDLNHTFSNQEGKFVFKTKLDSIKFKILGYEDLKISNKHLIKKDTILLKPKFFELDAVVITKNPKYLKMLQAINNVNPSKSFQENFFLRCVVVKNGSIEKIEDIIGNVSRQVLFGTKEKPTPKNNYLVEVKNLRKAGIFDGQVSFEMFSFKDVFNAFLTVNMLPKHHIFKEVSLQNEKYSKLEFQSKENEEYNRTGYYILEEPLSVIKEVFYHTKTPNAPFIKKAFIKYRTINYSMRVYFEKDINTGIYHIKNGKINLTVEVFFKKQKQPTIYNVTYILGINKVQTNYIIKDKVSIKKDIFRVKSDYNETFWSKQNYLPLTTEMENFIKSLEKKKENYKVKTNIKI